MSAHTPGPWLAKKQYGDRWEVYAETPPIGKAGFIASVNSDYHDGASCWEQAREADARLITAAPAMLAALKSLCASLAWEAERSGTTYAGYNDACDAIRAAEAGHS